MSDVITESKQEDTLADGVRGDVRNTDHGEFDMGSDDGSSSSSSSSSTSARSKYTFYHPLPRNAQRGFVVRLDPKFVHITLLCNI